MIRRAGDLPRRLVRVWREGRSDAEIHLGGYRAWRARLAEHGFPDIRGLRVLEVGCGDRAQISLLCSAEGADVTAVDTLPVALGMRRPRMWIALAREDGIRRAVRAIARDLLHTMRYWQTLAGRSGTSLPFRSIRVIRADAARLPFEGDTFDLILSSAVWEHLPDVETATGEVNRVLRPGGLAVIQIALFPALQGGHHSDWHSAAPDEDHSVRPWDHLRAGRRPLPTYLNEWRERQYRNVIERHLRIAAWVDGDLRGSELLTPELRAELADYEERELLLSSLEAWARKRS